MSPIVADLLMLTYLPMQNLSEPLLLQLLPQSPISGTYTSYTRRVPGTLSSQVSRSHDNLGPIIGGVVSALAVLVLIAVFFCFLKRRRGSKLLRMASPYMREKPLPAIRTSTGFPESHNLNLVADRVQEPSLDEPVEAGLMSRWRHPTTVQS